MSNTHLCDGERVALVDLSEPVHHLGEFTGVERLSGDLDHRLSLEAQGPAPKGEGVANDTRTGCQHFQTTTGPCNIWVWWMERAGRGVNWLVTAR